MAAAIIVGGAAVRAPALAAGVVAVGLLCTIPVRWLFAVLVVAASAQVASYPVGGITVRADEVVVLIFALRALCRRDRTEVGWPSWFAIAFVGFLAITSLLHALDARASLMSTGLLGVGVVAFVATATAAPTRNERTRWLQIWLVVAVASATIGIVAVASSLAFGTSFGVTRLADLGGFPAATGLAFEHNLFGSSCAIAAVVLLGAWRAGVHWGSSRLLLSGFWVTTMATVVSATRGAWIACVIGVVVVFLLLPRPARGRAFARILVQGTGVVLVVLAAAVALDGAQRLGDVAVEALRTQGQRAFELQMGTGGQRTREWGIALTEVQASPVFGFGTNSYGQHHVERTLRGNIPSYIGNWAVRTLYDAGVIGLAVLAMFLAGIVWPSHWLRHASGEQALVAGALVAGGIVLVFAYLAADGFLLVWPWVFLGMTWSWRQAARTEASASTHFA